jgi:hypothetical protein
LEAQLIAARKTIDDAQAAKMHAQTELDEQKRLLRNSENGTFFKQYSTTCPITFIKLTGLL